MRNLALVLVAACTLAGLTGCAILKAEVAPKVAKAVNAYCLEPQDARLLLRQQVNQAIAPNAVKVTCAGDPQ